MATQKLLAAAARKRSPAQARAQIAANKTASQRPPKPSVSSSHYFLVPMCPEIDEARKDCSEATELKALLRTMGDTHALVLFKHPAGIELWREGRRHATVLTIGEIYAYAELRGW